MGQMRLVFDAEGKMKVLGSPSPDNQGTFKLDPAQGHIDLTLEKPGQEPIHGIYKLEGDRLTIVPNLEVDVRQRLVVH